MAAYNFQKEFIPLIVSGVKRSTIRKRRKNGYLPRVGDVLRLYNGMRTKACKLIREATVTDVLPISINARNKCVDVVLNNEPLSNAAVEMLAKSDGFKDVAAFADFFETKYGSELQAYLIKWK